MEFHVSFDQETEFSNNKDIQYLLTKITKVVAVNFLKDPSSLSDVLTNKSFLTILVENDNDNLTEAIQKSCRSRYYSAEDFDTEIEELDTLEVEIAKRIKEFLSLTLEYDRVNCFPVYVIIVDDTFENIEEKSDSDHEDSLGIILEQVLFLKPSEFIQSVLGSTIKVVEDNLEDFLNSLPQTEYVEKTLDEMFETEEASV